MPLSSAYSGTPLLKKLGIKDGMKVMLIDAPKDYYQLLEKDISPQLCIKKESPDLVHLFIRSKKDLGIHLPYIQSIMKPDTIIWVSWYKKSAKIATDVTEDVIRGYALANKLVDVKVCAVSNDWSGLKLVVPLKLRMTL